MLVDGESVEVRFLVGLPAAGRRVLGREAEDLLVRQLPEAVHASLLYENVDGDAVTRHVLAAEDARQSEGHAGRGRIGGVCGGWQHTSQKERGGGRAFGRRDSVPFTGDVEKGVHSA